MAGPQRYVCFSPFVLSFTPALFPVDLFPFYPHLLAAYFEKLEKNSGVHTAFLCQQRDVSATHTQESPSQAIDRSREPAFSYDGRRNRGSERWFIDRVTTLPARIVEYVQYTWRDQIQPVQLQLAPFLRIWNGVCTRALCNRPFGEDSRGCGRGVISRGERPACALHTCGACKRWRPFCGPELVAQRHHRALLLRHSSLTSLHLALAHSLTCTLWSYIPHLHFYAFFPFP